MCLAAFLPGFFRLPTIDRDEARFAQASRQMLEAVLLTPAERDPALHAGGLVVPMVQDTPRLNKPPLIYWAQAASAAVLTGFEPMRDAIWMYRVPSLLAAVGTVLLTWRLGCRMFGPRVGILAAGMLAACPIFVWEARQARADHLLVCVTTLAMLLLWTTLRTRSRGWAAAFWLAVGLGVLTKGPITPMVALLAVAALALAGRTWRPLSGIRPIWGVFLAVLVVAPWVLAVATHVGFGEYVAIIHDETLGRSVSAKEGHSGPPGYHLLLVLALLWPGTLLLGYGVVRPWLRAKRAAKGPGWLSRTAATLRALVYDRPAEAFLLAWIVPSWIVFELVSTKLPHYTMPLYPALALLAARAMPPVVRGSAAIVRRGWFRALAWLWALFGVGVIVAAGGIGIALAAHDDRVAAASAAAAILAIAFAVPGVSMLLAIRRRRYLAAQVAAVAGAVMAWWAMIGVGLPGASVVDLSPRIAAALRAADETAAVGLVGYHEDSLIFATRGRAQRLADDQWRTWAASNPGALLVVQHDRLAAPPEGYPTERGFNYSRGKPVAVSIVPARDADRLR